jgi:DHA1 family multidrug resistance protein-like MFS transporter
MFDLALHPSAPIKRSKASESCQLAPAHWLLPPLEDDHSIYIVELTGGDDPANAKSWSVSCKMHTAAVLGFGTLVASWGSSVYSSAVEPVSQEFGVSSIVAILGLTFYTCGFATRPLAFAPLGELYGRK